MDTTKGTFYHHSENSHIVEVMGLLLDRGYSEEEAVSYIASRLNRPMEYVTDLFWGRQEVSPRDMKGTIKIKLALKKGIKVNWLIHPAVIERMNENRRAVNMPEIQPELVR